MARGTCRRSVTGAATGLQHKGQRWYSPDLGRFVSEDPIQDGSNWYMFAGNDPVNFADPSGLSQQGHPLGGGFSGNQTRAPSIRPGNIPANALSTLGNQLGHAVGSGRAPRSTPPPAVRPSTKPLSINDFTSLNDPGFVTRTVDPLKALASETQQTRAYWRQIEIDRHTVVKSEAFGGGWAGAGATAMGREYDVSAQESSSWAGYLGNKTASAGLKTSGFIANSVLGYTTPGQHVTYADGRTAMRLGGPDTASLANQASFFGPMILAGASRATQPGRGFVLGETSELTYPLGTADEQIAAFRAQQRINRGQLLEAPKAPHGNSLDYVGDTHVYAIRGPHGTHKIGESMQGTRVGDGASIRGEAQARALTKKTGDFYYSEIRNSFPGKESARTYETKFIETFKRLFGNDKLPGNKTNR